MENLQHLSELFQSHPMHAAAGQPWDFKLSSNMLVRSHVSLLITFYNQIQKEALNHLDLCIGYIEVSYSSAFA